MSENLLFSVLWEFCHILQAIRCQKRSQFSVFPFWRDFFFVLICPAARSAVRRNRSRPNYFLSNQNMTQSLFITTSI